MQLATNALLSKAEARTSIAEKEFWAIRDRLSNYRCIRPS